MRIRAHVVGRWGSDPCRLLLVEVMKKLSEGRRRQFSRRLRFSEGYNHE